MAKPLSARRVAILATDGVEQVELTAPLQALLDAGAEVEVVAPKPGSIQGFNHHDKGGRIPVDVTLDQAFCRKMIEEFAEGRHQRAAEWRRRFDAPARRGRFPERCGLAQPAGEAGRRSAAVPGRFGIRGGARKRSSLAGDVTVLVRGIAPGTYAAQAFHDFTARRETAR